MSSVNQKRLTKNQVKEILETDGNLDETLTAAFREEHESWINEPKVYELSDNRYLFVFDENDISTSGKGYICSREEICRRAEWHEDVRKSFARGGGNSVEDWRHYSILGNQLVENIESLIYELCLASGLSPSQLDKSYKSLTLLSEFLVGIGYQESRSKFFDHLVAYVGEVLRIRCEGVWHIRISHDSMGYPCIIKLKRDREMMPINVVWQALDAMGGCELRQPTINEYRNYCIQNKA